MRKYHLLAGSLAALAATLAGAPTAQAQTWNTSQSIAGTVGGTPSLFPVWSIGTRSGVNCDQGAFTPLTNNYTGSLAPNFIGKGSNGWPAVLKNVSTLSNFPAMIVPPNSIFMHPGGGAAQACVILRFTAPPSPVAAAMNFKVSAHFKGAYIQPGSNPQVNGYAAGTGAMNGVNGMVRVTRNWQIPALQNVQLGNVVDTVTLGGGSISSAPLTIALKPGDTIDFAAHNKGAYNYDSTILTGAVVR